MRSLALLLFAPVALAAAAAVREPAPGPRQDPAAGQEEEESLPPLLRLRKEREKYLTEGVPGCWQLDGFEVSGVATPREEITGYVLFCDGYMALVIHAIGFDPVNSEEVPVAQAGIFRYRVDEFGALQTSTVLGHSNLFGEVEYEQGGELREYSLDLDQTFLTFRHADGTVFKFSKLVESPLIAGGLAGLLREPAADADAGDELGAEGEDEVAANGDLAPLLAFRLAQKEAAEEGMKGSWQLLDYIQNGAEAPEGEITARALFCDGYAALVIHAIGFDPVNAEEIYLVQAGLFRYRIDEGEKLSTSTLIGHANLVGDLEWEAQGGVREYTVVFEKGQAANSDILTLRHLGGTTMRFGRTGAGSISQPEIDRLNLLRGQKVDRR